MGCRLGKRCPHCKSWNNRSYRGSLLWQQCHECGLLWIYTHRPTKLQVEVLKIISVQGARLWLKWAGRTDPGYSVGTAFYVMHKDIGVCKAKTFDVLEDHGYFKKHETNRNEETYNFYYTHAGLE